MGSAGGRGCSAVAVAVNWLGPFLAELESCFPPTGIVTGHHIVTRTYLLMPGMYGDKPRRSSYGIPMTTLFELGLCLTRITSASFVISSLKFCVRQARLSRVRSQPSNRAKYGSAGQAAVRRPVPGPAFWSFAHLKLKGGTAIAPSSNAVVACFASCFDFFAGNLMRPCRVYRPENSFSCPC